MKNKKVLVAGYFDLFHSGHTAFLDKASNYGELYVVVGSDDSSIINKNKRPIYTQSERSYIVSMMKCVSEVYTPDDCSLLNFSPYLDEVDIFLTNEDGDSKEKRDLCLAHNVKYVVLNRVPHGNLKQRSSSSIKCELNLIPQRIDISGFYDQKTINSLFPGSVILANINPIDSDLRSGLSSSTINVIKKIFGPCLPKHIDRLDLAKMIFALENPPDRKYISGVVDQLGICLPGINRLHFKKEYFPSKIEKAPDSAVDFLSKYCYLKQTKPRPLDYQVFDGKEKINLESARSLSEAADICWKSLLDENIKELGQSINIVHNTQKNMIPGYESDFIRPIINEIQKNHFGAKIMGAGGYGYIFVLTENPESDFIKINITK
ncbi:adenylyltransferase/cytidyltransferase family protein [Verrucomicrobia bacterium]|nr:adenylyltransferase/cytidyltransferase family protein [bacterium]MDB4795271.1 adenylyltransferase/cytidyltransferase family protein [Verrucomicrobiota bacterium]MDC0317834.1 adenylyltransferase/cytidyltransferase family protein [bacterium]